VAHEWREGVSASSERSRKLKVVDRRWFTEDGQLREDRAAAPVPPRDKPAADSPAGKKPQTTETSPTAVTSPYFLELVRLLAQQAEMLLAGAPGIPRQVDQGLQMIELLATLENKTRGNLSAEESQLLSNILFQLRTLSARVAR
jgi:hypothetical protein